MASDSQHSSSNGERAAGQMLAGCYRLEQLLGRGGMGEVWRARHTDTDQVVAIKLIKHNLDQQPDMRRRFLREVRAMSAADHPNAVGVLEVLEDPKGTPILVMPLLEGETLTSLLRRAGPLSLAQGLDILLPIVCAVGAAHEQGILHRDLKPDNVFLAVQGGATIVKVLDFGIAKLLVGDGDGDATLTRTGSVVGTLCYMSPEQSLGERGQDHRVDIWAIGVMAYEMLGGCRPVEADNIAQLVRSFLTQAITPLEVIAPPLPEEISQLVMQMLKTDRDSRPASLREVQIALERAAQANPKS